MHRRVLAVSITGGLGAALIPAAVQAQALTEVTASIRSGIVGERFDGYLGFAATPSEAVRKQVGAINIRRRTLYIGLASRRNVTPQVAGFAAACELMQRVAVGQSYMLSDGVWRRRQAGASPPRPDHCPG